MKCPWHAHSCVETTSWRLWWRSTWARSCACRWWSCCCLTVRTTSHLSARTRAPGSGGINVRQPSGSLRSFLFILFFKCSFIFSSSSESDLNSSGQQPDENREHKTGSKERKMSVDIVRDLSLLPLVSCSHACCETVLKTLELMSQLKQHVDDMETCFYRMLQVKC